MLENQQMENMQKYIDIISNSILFKNIEKNDLENLVNCLGSKIKTYAKDDFVFNDNKNNTLSGIVISGALHVIQYDFAGNRSILSRIEPLQLFGESYSFCEKKESLNIIAAEKSVVMLFNSLKISNPCSNHCKFHVTLINNLLKIMANKNIYLNKKLQCLSQRTTREKLLSYLYSQAPETKGTEFTIPYDRQSLADYLCVERSAMSTEISKLCKDKIIECKKNNFKFL